MVDLNSDMRCFSCNCFSSHATRERMLSTRGNASMPFPENKKKRFGIRSKSCAKGLGNDKISAESFTFRELACATNNFRPDNLLGEGGFSRVYKGTLHRSGEVVAIKQMDKNGISGNKEFLLEVTTLSRLSHKNLVDFIGYCFDGDQRLLVFRYLSGGTLANRMFDAGITLDQEPLDWITRMKIAYGAAKGLEYLHDETQPPIIHGYLKASSILLDEDLNPKLSDFGVPEFGDGQEKMQVSARVMKTYGYCAPEYTSTGQLTLKSDVYSFGVVLLELINGGKVIDTTRPNDEQNLVNWANPRFRDPKQFPEMVDPLLEGKFPEKDLNQAGQGASAFPRRVATPSIATSRIAPLDSVLLLPRPVIAWDAICEPQNACFHSHYYIKLFCPRVGFRSGF